MTPGHSIESHGVLENYNLYNFALEKHTFSYNLTQVTVALGNRFVSILRTSNIMFHTVQYSTVQCSSVQFIFKQVSYLQNTTAPQKILAFRSQSSLPCDALASVPQKIVNFYRHGSVYILIKVP